MDIWIFRTLIHLFITSAYIEIKFSKNEVVAKLVFVMGSFCTPHSMVLDRAVFYKSVALSTVILSTKRR